MTRHRHWIYILCGFVLLTGTAQAQLSYEFADSTGTATTNFSINSLGGTVAIRVYLHDTTRGATILNANGGLGSAAVRLTYNSPSGVARVNSLASDVTGAIPPWSAYTTLGSDVPNNAVINEFSSTTAGVLPDSDGRIFLGTFVLTGIAPGTVNLTATDPNSTTNFDTTYFVTGDGIDSQIADANAVLTFTVVPEPQVTIVLSIVGLFGLRGMWSLAFGK
ncbi:MAG: hypothetical protein U0798_08495 [Gemmataceae bacterium]